MDEAFRQAERDQDWEGQAHALRRAGREGLARVTVVAAARAGLPSAAELLAAEFPLDRDAEALLRIVHETPPNAWGVEAPRAVELLLGDGDPRLAEPALAWLAANAAAADAGDAGVLPPSDLRASFLEADHLGRVELLVRNPGAGLDRTRLLPHELLSLGERLLTGSLGEAPRLRLAALCERLPEPSSEVEALRERALKGDEAAAGERIAWVERGRAGGLDSDLPWRPDWVRPVHREDLTLSLSRGALRPWGRSPVGVELPDATWVALLDVDHFMTFNDRFGHVLGDQLLVRITEVLQEAFGDRVVRYGGDEWLVPLEREDAPERVQGALDAVRRDPRLLELCGGARLSAGLARRTGASAKDLHEADLALYEAKRAGRGRLRVAPRS